MTPMPEQFLANDTQYGVLMATNFLGINTPLIIANRTEYALYTVLAVTAMASYTAESAASVGTIQPLAAPPLSAIPVSADPSLSAGLANTQPVRQLVVDGIKTMTPSAVQSVSATAPMLSQLVSQPSNAALGSGLTSEFSQAPTAMTSGLGALPGMAQASMGSGLSSQAAQGSGATLAGAAPRRLVGCAARVGRNDGCGVIRRGCGFGRSGRRDTGPFAGSRVVGVDDKRG